MNFLNAISQVKGVSNTKEITNKTGGDEEGFLSVLKETINETNDQLVSADMASASIATGSVKDLHQAAITIDKAEINMKMMLEVRNKALTAYKDILRTQV